MSNDSVDAAVPMAKVSIIRHGEEILVQPRKLPDYGEMFTKEEGVVKKDSLVMSPMPEGITPTSKQEKNETRFAFSSPQSKSISKSKSKGKNNNAKQSN